MKYSIMIAFIINTQVIAQQLPHFETFQELGLTVEVPQGWKWQLANGIVKLENKQLSSIMFITQNKVQTIHELKLYADMGLFDQGLYLVPVYDFEIINNFKISGYYQGHFNTRAVKAFSISLMNHKGNSVTIIILSESSQFSSQHFSIVKLLAKSIIFTY